MNNIFDVTGIYLVDKKYGAEKTLRTLVYDNYLRSGMTTDESLYYTNKYIEEFYKLILNPHE